MSGFRGRGGARSSYTAQPKGLFVNGAWKCDCSPPLPAVHFQTKKEGPNKGRWFYTCQKRKDDANRCKFFLWDTDAKPREESALLNNSRTEPGRTNEMPARPQRASTPPPPNTIATSASEPAKKRTWAAVQAEDDEFVLDKGNSAFDDELDRVMKAVETPRKTARIDDAHTTPKRRLPWDKPVNGIPTPQTERRAPEDPFATWFSYPGGSLLTPSKHKEPCDVSPDPLTPSSSCETPTPSRFRDMTSARSDNSLVDDVFNLLNEEDVHISSKAAIALGNFLTKHARRAEGNNKSKEVLRLRIKAEEAKNAELTHRNNTLQAELEAAKATVSYVTWQRDNDPDI